MADKKSRKEKERARQKKVRDTLDKKPVPGGPTAMVGKKVNKGLNRAKRMMKEDKRQRKK